MQVPILQGIYTDSSGDFRQSYPKNLVPVPLQNGVSSGYLRPADGLVKQGDGPGEDRGGINWDNVCYRVMGSKLVAIREDGSLEIIGDVGDNDKLVSMTYSFDYLAIASDRKLWLYDKQELKQVDDPDTGVVLDVIWVDGYFMFTDGEFIVVTEIDDPFSVIPTKYGSSEANPDDINGLLKLRNESYAINRYSIEVFTNVGGGGFPFQRISGAHIERGAVGTHASTIYNNTLAFVGSALNEANAVWVGVSGQTSKISTREIDIILSGYTEAELSIINMETKFDKGYNHLYIHLKDQTLVYDAVASQEFSTPVWFILTSTLTGLGEYRANNFVYCYDRWLVGDPSSFAYGYTTDKVSNHNGLEIGWEFGTSIVYNETNGAQFHELELVSLTGRTAFGDNPTIWTSYSHDGVTFSNERGIKAGKQGARNKRLIWLQQGHMESTRIQRFRGTSDAFISIARLEARIEPLSE